MSSGPIGGVCRLLRDDGISARTAIIPPWFGGSRQSLKNPYVHVISITVRRSYLCGN